MEKSKIEWTDNTFNPWTGCTKVSPGCANCYAELSEATRFKKVEWGRGTSRLLNSDDYWEKPLKWNTTAKAEGTRMKVFCASTADVFDDEVNPEWRTRLWKLIKDCPWLDWQLLTKRPQNMPGMLPSDWGNGWENVWLGTSVENQEWANARIPLLTAVPAKVHFLSVEPLLGPIQFTTLNDIEWIILGGESGPGSRAMDKTWVVDIQGQVSAADIPFFFKQWGQHNERQERMGSKKDAGHELDGKTYREFPVVTVAVAPDASDLARDEINRLHGEINDHARMTLAKALTIGGKLTEIKAALNYGQFGKWVKSDLKFDQRTAQRYMKLFEGRETIKIDTMSNLAEALREIDKGKQAKRKETALALKAGSSSEAGHEPSLRMSVGGAMGDGQLSAEETAGVHDVPALDIIESRVQPVLVLEAPEEILAEFLALARRHEDQCRFQVIREGGEISLNDHFTQRLGLEVHHG
jgi:protein gp37